MRHVRRFAHADALVFLAAVLAEAAQLCATDLTNALRRSRKAP